MNQSDYSNPPKAAADTAARNEIALNSSSDEISLIDLILILWKGKYIIAACTILATIAGVIYALLAPEVFSSTSHFITKTGRSGGGGNLGQLAALAGVSTGGSGNIDPSDYLDKVIQDQSFIASLYERTWFFNGDSLPLEQILAIEKDTTASNWQYKYYMSKIEKIRKGKILNISKDSKTGILTLSSTAPTARLAYDLNRYTLDFISDYIRNSLQTQAREKRRFIEERIREVKTDLERSENNLVRFKERNIMSRSPQIAVEEARLARQVTLNQEIYLQFQKQYEMARIEELDDQTLIQVVKSPEEPVKRSEPKRQLIVAVALLSGAFLGIFSAFLIHSLPLIKNALRQKSIG